MRRVVDTLRPLWWVSLLAFMACCGVPPEELYAECEDRVEAPEREAECTTDDDCMTSGCSGETCTTQDDAGELVSACEVLECFEVLDECGCQQGRCRWSIHQ